MPRVPRAGIRHSSASLNGYNGLVLIFSLPYGRPWRNWIAHLTSDQRVAGSNPAGRASGRGEKTVLGGGFLLIVNRYRRTLS